MPHKQKEGHDHTSFSKKQALEKKRAKEAAKRAKEEAARIEEEARKLLLPNNVPLVEGHGEYELGYEPDEKEHRFNKLKRCKKHLRNDLRLKQLKEEEERRAAEEERRRRERLAAEAEAARHCREERRAAGEEVTDSEDEDSSSEEEYEELVIYFCECCNRKFASRNTFVNHLNSRRHRINAAPYEEAGLLVYTLEMKTAANGEGCSEEEADTDSDGEEVEDADDAVKPKAIGFAALTLGDSSSDDEDDDGGGANTDESDEGATEDDVGGAEDEGEDVLEETKPKPSVFAALGDCESSSGESSDDEEPDENEGSAFHTLPPPAHVMTDAELAAQAAAEEEAEDLYLEDLIVQNHLRQAEIDAVNKERRTSNLDNLHHAPLPFTGEFDADLYPGINEARYARIRHRLQSKLAARGIEPNVSELTELCNGLDPIALGRTLLQQVMAARMDNLQARLDAYNAYKKENQLMVREFAFANGNSKALPSQYTYRLDPADNARRRANVHHAGSHYHMASASGRTKGTVAGLSSRHSSQGQRLQASRMQAREAAMMQGGGKMTSNKSGKVTSKKLGGKRGNTAGKMGDGGDA